MIPMRWRAGCIGWPGGLRSARGAGCQRGKNAKKPGPRKSLSLLDDRLQRDELGAIVHEEIDRLADVQRLPILLCALEGLSHEEAAQRLRWPLGTVKSRLVRGAGGCKAA